MKGLVIYAANARRALEISGYLEKQKGYRFDIKSIKSITAIPNDATYIACDWGARIEFYKLVCNLGSKYGIAFYNDAFISDVDNTATLDDALGVAIKNKNWEICKGINQFYLMGDIIRKRNVLKSNPSKLQIETTDLCNAKCIMCSHAYDDGTGIDILRSGIIERLESILPFIKFIVLHGNGEPFLKKDIADYLRRMSQYGVKFITNTNLSIITDELIPFLQTSFAELNVSCDGHTASLYEHIRKGLSFERFVNNARRVREECPDLCMKMSVVVMRQNMKYMPEIVDFAADLGFDEIVFNQLCVDEKNNNLQDAAYFYPNELKKYTNMAKNKGKAREILVTVSDMLDSKDIESATMQNHNSIIQCNGICDWVVECPYIDLRGNVSVCCINQKIYLGNLFTDSFNSIWNGASYKKIRAEFNCGTLPSPCIGCDFLNQKRLRYLSAEEYGFQLIKKEKRI